MPLIVVFGRICLPDLGMIRPMGAPLRSKIVPADHCSGDASCTKPTQSDQRSLSVSALVSLEFRALAGHGFVSYTSKVPKSRFAIERRVTSHGGVAEWPIASVLKTDNAERRSGVRIPPPPLVFVAKPPCFAGFRVSSDQKSKCPLAFRHISVTGDSCAVTNDCHDWRTLQISRWRTR